MDDASRPRIHEQPTSADIAAASAAAAIAATGISVTNACWRENILFELPDVLITLVLAEYLGELKSIARLLIATNNRKSCDSLHRALVFMAKFPVRNFDTEQSFSPACVKWLRRYPCISVSKLVVDPKIVKTMADLPVDQLKQLDTLVITSTISEDLFNSLVSPSSCACSLKTLSYNAWTSQSVQRIGEQLKNLETLILENRRYGSNEIDSAEAVTAAIGKGCPRLTTLKTSLKMTDAALSNFANHHLRVLHLTCSVLTSDYLVALLRRPAMAMLEELVLGGINWEEDLHILDRVRLSSDDVLCAIAANCHSMRKVALYFERGDTGRGLAELASKCHLLSSLRLEFFGGSLTDEGVGQLTVGAFHALAEAEVLICDGYGEDNLGDGLTQKGVDQLVASFCTVRALKLENNAVSGWEVGRTVNLCPLTEKLELGGFHLNDRHLADVALPSLVTLKVDGSDSDGGGEYNRLVSDEGVAAIVIAHGRSLTSLSVCCFANVRDEFLRKISMACPSLLSLQLENWSFGFSDLGLVYISNGFPALQSIRVEFYYESYHWKNSPPISGEGIMALRLLATDQHLTSVEIVNAASRFEYSYSLALRAAFPPTCVLK